ncbi:Oidioi.mRNA.OKI2018_I69.chr2.g7674.t1.cds [Oikopleura dioica]|uniref:Oidioi.mRNA.OKI2018_I69.chr2.g7674.t1.cds n=1 Tax=Oikopleura dioica TaxID=34765 RepID=A0ABN7TCU3_OIKDI|nr:Oidioi.mRNA.OKI2018_I69.chr2.g7674.t1.cds [Oikopleura dioica]
MGDEDSNRRSRLTVLQKLWAGIIFGMPGAIITAPFYTRAFAPVSSYPREQIQTAAGPISHTIIPTMSDYFSNKESKRKEFERNFKRAYAIEYYNQETRDMEKKFRWRMEMLTKERFLDTQNFEQLRLPILMCLLYSVLWVFIYSRISSMVTKTQSKNILFKRGLSPSGNPFYTSIGSAKQQWFKAYRYNILVTKGFGFMVGFFVGVLVVFPPF